MTGSMKVTGAVATCGPGSSTPSMNCNANRPDPPRQTSRGAAPRGLWRLNKGPHTFSDQEAKGIAAPCLGGEVMLTKISERGVDSRSVWTFPDTAEMGHAGAAVAARALRGEYQVDLNEDL